MQHLAGARLYLFRLLRAGVAPVLDACVTLRVWNTL